MYLDDAVLKAKEECVRFLSSPHNTRKAEAEALTPVLVSMRMVLSATNLATGMGKKDGVALEIYKAHREAMNLCQIVKVSITQNGKLVKEDTITCCPKACSVIASQVYEVEAEALIVSGVDSKTLVTNMHTFLNDPTSSMMSLGSSMKN